MRICVSILGLIFLLLGCAAMAKADGWNEETFEYYASIVRQLPETHSRMIDDCARNGIAKMDNETKEQLKRAVPKPIDETTREICRRLVKGIASGAVTYEVFRTWLDSPDGGKVSLPDHQ
ncbi:UNVERIFIED_ORG: ABC-type arginine transport system permease subunit [Rhizobium esperanzae]|uniref:Lipoprotein n=2 Tax=Rhizobium phaseoli TaxID=396 RepID=A0ABM6CBC5_9HYPH|nr:hypothetical protein AMC88_CH02763 [Rhizobium phaseoli]MDH6650798.1 ABC-type arginine transport system permease subunit [Rhizobium esperanzae]ANL53873.1 hypothetical protein AMC86_CH02748 [Rhizobium phaseoli]ANL60126.1 hypothetical protein AMC85_CH02762 [Rhizobium phaseoli]ANL85519.1 hypothetical protein AMC81_CH02759 [Rhizobium phaseoli]